MPRAAHYMVEAAALTARLQGRTHAARTHLHTHTGGWEKGVPVQYSTPLAARNHASASAGRRGERMRTQRGHKTIEFP